MPDSLQNYTHIEFNKGCSGDRNTDRVFQYSAYIRMTASSSALCIILIRNAYIHVSLYLYTHIRRSVNNVVLIFALDLCQISLKMSATNFFHHFQEIVSTLYESVSGG